MSGIHFVPREKPLGSATPGPPASGKVTAFAEVATPHRLLEGASFRRPTLPRFLIHLEGALVGLSPPTWRARVPLRPSPGPSAARAPGSRRWLRGAPPLPLPSPAAATLTCLTDVPPRRLAASPLSSVSHPAARVIFLTADQMPSVSPSKPFKQHCRWSSVLQEVTSHTEAPDPGGTDCPA